ncbi:MAG: fatty acid desaturase family protein [Parvularculaceae bacterium]
MSVRSELMNEVTAFPLREAQEIAIGFIKPKPMIYWTDFLLSAALGWASFVLAVTAPAFSLMQIGGAVISALALYRAAIFTHELAHLKRGSFGAFRFVWNLLCGVPLMVPSFTYSGVHLDHHRSNIYGTRQDGEYIAFAVSRPVNIITYMFLIFLLPLLMASRFIILTPLSYFIPPLRRLIWSRLSSLAIDLSYQRPASGKRDDASWRLQEFSAFVFGACVIVLTVLGVLPVSVIILWYAVAVMIFLLNSLRTLAAHAYRNPGDVPMSREEEFLDSVNVPGAPVLTALWAPVGLRFHATHHLFPSMPYHELAKAHRALVQRLPNNTLYLSASRKSLLNALSRLWNESRQATVK